MRSILGKEESRLDVRTFSWILRLAQWKVQDQQQNQCFHVCRQPDQCLPTRKTDTLFTIFINLLIKINISIVLLSDWYGGNTLLQPSDGAIVLDRLLELGQRFRHHIIHLKIILKHVGFRIDFMAGCFRKQTCLISVFQEILFRRYSMAD